MSIVNGAMKIGAQTIDFIRVPMWRKVPLISLINKELAECPFCCALMRPEKRHKHWQWHQEVPESEGESS